MRCCSYTTASSYLLPGLSKVLSHKGNIKEYPGILHLNIPGDGKNPKEIFIFGFGVIVFWGFTKDQEKQIIPLLRKFEKGSFKNIEIENFGYDYGKATKIEGDQFILEDKKPSTKIAISYGIAQSAKLSVFENKIQETINQSKQIPIQLAEKGKISLSRRETSRKIGEIFLERNFITLHSQILDIPDFFWDHPFLENLYTQTIHYLGVNKRIELLDKRLNILHELYEILSNELNNQHGARLEWIIIVLILIEVIIVVFKDILHII